MTELPALPCSFQKFPQYLQNAKTQQDVGRALSPFKDYERKLRQIYAQEADHPAVRQSHLAPLYQNASYDLKTRARDIQSQSIEEQEKFLLPLSADARRKDGTKAITSNLREFQKNFNIFSESALTDLDWSNVVAAGSSVVTSLLPVEAPHNESKRALRTYYHEVLAPASDVDLFIYGLNEAQAVEKIKQIEARVRDSILSETTVVRTKNAITIVSEYPVRHIQIVLRLYKSVTEILTGFDVDCACVAYDGNEIWAAPRAIAAFSMQRNNVDLTRRSPSYENRLSKYSHRGFEVYWPLLERSKVDPTIYERAFNRVQGLARLLVLEKLPHPQDRDQYLNKRRVEKGRSELPWNARFRTQLPGNIKDAQPDDVAEWVADDTVSSYHSFSIPWGPRYTPKKIERLLFQQDLLKNAEFNRPKDREANLHRHPAFFGRVEDVISDCCGYCPRPESDADLAAWDEESKIYVSGSISFLADDPGRQEIGSFHPLTDDDWTDMAYIGSTDILCRAIVDKDLQAVSEWFHLEGANVNKRDHTGRTPLQLAVISSSPEVVQYLIDRKARIVARLYNGMTALHLAAWRGSAEMVKLLLDKSAENEDEEDTKEEKRKQARRQIADRDLAKADEDDEMTQVGEADKPESESGDSMEVDSNADSDDRMTGSFVQIKSASESAIPKDNDDDPDVFDVDVLAWDSPCSALHLAIMAGHQHVISLLIDSYGADVMLPIKLMTNDMPRQAAGAVLSLLLALDLPTTGASEITKLLLQKGASPLQASTRHKTALHQIVALNKTRILEVLQQEKPEAVAKGINYLTVNNHYWSLANVDNPLLSAIKTGSTELVHKLLALGAEPTIGLEEFVRAYNANKDHRHYEDPDKQREFYYNSVTQPIIEAAQHDDMIDIVIQLLDRGAGVNTLTAKSWALVQEPAYRYSKEDKTLLDLIRNRRKELETFVSGDKTSKSTIKKPQDMEADEYYLNGFEDGTYQLWSASRDLETVKYIQCERNLAFIRDQKSCVSESLSISRQEAVSVLIRKYKAAELRLIEDGAKSFYEIYPDLQEKSASLDHSSPIEDNEKSRSEPFYRTQFKFFGRDVTPSREEQYIKLFEAAFTGNTAAVKELCLSSTDINRPLEVAVSDHNGFTPFSIAVLKGHMDLGSIILDIAAAQYKGTEESRLTTYSLYPFDDDDSSSDNDSVVTGDPDQPRFYQRLINDKFTIDDVASLAKEIKSDTSPLQLLIGRDAQVWRFLPSDRAEALQKFRLRQVFDPNPYVWGVAPDVPADKFKNCWEQELNRTKSSIFTYAVVKNDVTLLKYLLHNEVKYSTRDENELLKSLVDRNDALKHAMNLGYVEIVDNILRARGSLLPLQHLATESGVVIDETPRFYQGLSVHGKKRKDWAKQVEFVVDQTDHGSPFLNAVIDGNLDIIDYFMSNTPLRRYEEFCLQFSQDQRIRALSESPGGLSTALNTWFGTRTNLVLHMAVMSWPAGANKTLKHLLPKVPSECLETRSVTGDTPLHLALKIGNIPAFKLLLKLGANQRTRDKKGHNLLHTIYARSQPSRILWLQQTIAMLDQSILPKLLTERGTGSESGLLTPLALHLKEVNYGEEGFELLDHMLLLSHGMDLSIMDGAGDFPLHAEVRRGNASKAERAIYIAKKRPNLLYLENATGLTALEVAETAYMQTRMKEPRLDNSEAQITSPDYDNQLAARSALCERELDDENVSISNTLYNDLVRIARATPQTRKLVSLFDAHEVARRLAGQEKRNNAVFRRRQAQGLKTRWHRYYPRDEGTGNEQTEGDEPAKQDEVSRWLENARTRYGGLPFGNHSKDFDTEMEEWNAFADGETESVRCCDKVDSVDSDERRGHYQMGRKIENSAT